MGERERLLCALSCLFTVLSLLQEIKCFGGEAEPSPSSHRLSYRTVLSPCVLLMSLCFNSPLASRLYSPTNSTVSRTQTRAVAGPVSSPDLPHRPPTGWQVPSPDTRRVASVLGIARLCPAQRPCFFFLLLFYELAAPLPPLDCP